MSNLTKLIFYILISSSVVYGFNNTNYRLVLSSENRNSVLISLGAGVSYFKTSFVLSPSFIAEVSKYINISTGIDYYSNSESFDRSFSVNLLPYFVLNTSQSTYLQIGIGGAYYRRSFAPIFSTRFNIEIKKNINLGTEIKSLIALGSDEYPFPILLLNCSFRL